MLNKLIQMIKQAVITATSDNTAYPQGQSKYNGKTTNYTRLSPYGLCTNPPNDSLVLLFSSQAQESVKFGIADDMLNRFKDLGKGEVVLFNYSSGAYVYLKANGDVVIDSPGNIDATAGGSATIKAPTITLDGNVTVTGTLDVTGKSTLSSADINGITFSTHVHGGVQTGASNTGGPQ